MNYKKLKNDKKLDFAILKLFYKYKEPGFIIYLGLNHYSMDYYYGIIPQILKKTKKLTCAPSDWDKETKQNMLNYINKQGNYNDRIFFHLMKCCDNIIRKYYNEDGVLKKQK